MRQILKNKTLDNQLKEEGYVIVPFLNEQELISLKNVFDNIKYDEINSFFASAHHPNLDFRKKTSDIINEEYSRSVNDLFIDMDLLGGSYISKPSNYLEILQPHQDWNIVDENMFRSYNIWVPLIDTNNHNGAIMIMPQSHNWVKSYRHNSIPCVYNQVHHLLLKHMKTLKLKAGEALIYDHALIHASHKNENEKIRIACAAGIKPKEAEMLFYWNNNGTIEEYESNADFFMSQNVFLKPTTLKKINDKIYSFPEINESVFYSLSNIKKPEEIQIHNKEDSFSQTEKHSFFKTYSPMNIYREIKLRLFK